MRFIRKNGRVIPIRDSSDGASGAKRAGVAVAGAVASTGLAHAAVSAAKKSRRFEANVPGIEVRAAGLRSLADAAYTKLHARVLEVNKAGKSFVGDEGIYRAARPAAKLLRNAERVEKLGALTKTTAARLHGRALALGAAAVAVLGAAAVYSLRGSKKKQ